MKIDYIKLSPTQNITVLVRTPIPRAQQAEIAARLLRDPRVGGEQVGYIESSPHSPAGVRLQMMGGEFCGNATMSLGAVLAREAGLPDGGHMDYQLEVSGSDALVPCHVARAGDAWVGSVCMPLPKRIGSFSMEINGRPLNLPLVELPGIAHLIIPTYLGIDGGILRRHLPRWQQNLGCDALGALLWDADAAHIEPLVYVPSAGTLVHEHGCGSGSAAIGCWLAHCAGQSYNIDVHQPGGTINVRGEVSGDALVSVTITGRVMLLDEGTVALSEEVSI